MDNQRDYPGSHTAAYFAARGVDLSADEALELVRVFVRLAELGAVTGAPVDECRGSSPSTPAQAGVSCADRGAGDGRAHPHRLPEARSGLEGPTVYNMGPSDYTDGSL